jgi:twitching motility protein PilI
MAEQGAGGPQAGTDAQAARLREYTAQVAAKLRQVPDGPVEPARLAVRIGERRYLLDMADTGEILPTPSITPVPWTRPWFLGLANVRGRLVGVVDLPALCGEAPLQAESAPQLLVANETLRLNFGLLMNRAFGLRNLRDLERLSDADSDPARRRRPWETRRYRDADGSVLVELDLRRLAGNEDFLSIGVRG